MDHVTIIKYLKIDVNKVTKNIQSKLTKIIMI